MSRRSRTSAEIARALVGPKAVPVCVDTVPDEVRREMYRVNGLAIFTAGSRNIAYLPPEFVQQHDLEVARLKTL